MSSDKDTSLDTSGSLSSALQESCSLDTTRSDVQDDEKKQQTPPSEGRRITRSPSLTVADASHDSGLHESSGAPPDARPGGSIAITGPPIRRRDKPHMFEELAPRFGYCKPGKAITVQANVYRVRAPSKLTAYHYNVEFQKMVKGTWEPMVKREDCGPNFWKIVQQDNKSVFPSIDRMVYNDVNTLYTSERLRLNLDRADYQTFELRQESPTPAAGRGGGRGGRGGRGGGRGGPARGPAPIRMLVKPAPLHSVAVGSDEVADQSFLREFIDLLITQQHRCPLSPNHGRFVTHGRRLFRIPLGPNADLWKSSIGCGQEIWHGLHGALKPDCEAGLLYNVNAASTPFYKLRLNVAEFYGEIIQGYNMGTTLSNEMIANLAMHPRDIEKLMKEIVGKKIIIVHPINGEKKKKCTGISFKPAAIETFSMDGRMITVQEFFFRQYSVCLLAPGLPCLTFGIGQNRVSIPMEFCYTDVEPRKVRGKLDERQLAAIIKGGQRVPDSQKALIKRMTDPAGDHLPATDEWQSSFEVSIDRDFLETEAKVMPMPHFVFRDRVTGAEQCTDPLPLTEKAESMSITVPDARNRRLPRPLLRKTPAILPYFYFISHVDQDHDWQRCVNFVKTLNEFGVEAADPACYHSPDFPNVNVDHIMTTIKEQQDKAKELEKLEEKRVIVMIFFVMKQKNKPLYGFLKSLCDVEVGVASQCIKRSTFSGITESPQLTFTNATTNNLVLKVIGKMGGLLFKLDRNFHKNWAKATDPEDPTLFLAIDVSHPGAEERAKAAQKAEQRGAGGNGRGRGGRGGGFSDRNRRPGTSQSSSSSGSGGDPFEGFSHSDAPRSVLAVVGNIDTDAMRFGSSIRVQRTSQEMGTWMVEPIQERIVAFHKATGLWPKNIVVYRDGISNTDFQSILQNERISIEQACQNIGDLKPTLTYIVAQKRHHMRFFPIDNANRTGTAGNPPSGLLVEKTVTSRSLFDFFIQSHFGSLGTARPTHYTILLNGWCPSPSFWQTVIYAHSFANIRTDKPISLPAPLHYAHLAAKKGKEHFDHFMENPPEDYIRAAPIRREDMERAAVSTHQSIVDYEGMPFL